MKAERPAIKRRVKQHLSTPFLMPRHLMRHKQMRHKQTTIQINRDIRNSSDPARAILRLPVKLLIARAPKAILALHPRIGIDLIRRWSSAILPEEVQPIAIPPQQRMRIVMATKALSRASTNLITRSLVGSTPIRYPRPRPFRRAMIRLGINCLGRVKAVAPKVYQPWKEPANPAQNNWKVRKLPR